MPTETPDRILRINTVLERTGLSRSTMYRKMQNGTFPANLKISERCAGWRESAVAEWQKNPMFYDVAITRPSNRPTRASGHPAVSMARTPALGNCNRPPDVDRAWDPARRCS
jgi:prophage regulatory protein